MKKYLAPGLVLIVVIALVRLLPAALERKAAVSGGTVSTKEYVTQVTLQLPYLPDPALTPGVTNPDITQENIGDNICNPNWSTKSIRPPSSYTTNLKKEQLAGIYESVDSNTANYEEDHLISLELGGHPTDPANLWPEPYTPVPGAKQKDAVENYLHKQVCAGGISLREAQREIATNWYAVYVSVYGNKAGGVTLPEGNDNDDN